MAYDERADMIQYMQNKLFDSGSTFPMIQISVVNANRIVKMLQQPVMPEHPSNELLNAMSQFYGDRRDHNAKRYEALRAALTTPPKPKTKTVWKFSYTFVDVNHVDEYSVEVEANHSRNSVIRHAKANKYSNISPIWSEEVEDK
jgi:hypothetical protein